MKVAVIAVASVDAVVRGGGGVRGPRLRLLQRGGLLVQRPPRGLAHGVAVVEGTSRLQLRLLEVGPLEKLAVVLEGRAWAKQP